MNDLHRDRPPVETAKVLHQLQRLAFAVTVGAAVLAGVIWLFTALVDDNPAWTDTAAGFFTGVVFVGGICMGLLYVAERLKDARAD